ncbi:MAG: FtsX-like permease family protein [Pseudomonadales bacterium]
MSGVQGVVGGSRGRRTARRTGFGGVTGPLAWRNLWRNRRRTWLTAGGIGFAAWLQVFAMSMQDGTFGTMVDNAARLLTGHLQVQRPDYHDDPRLEHVLDDATSLREQALRLPGVTAALPRAQAFALAAGEDRSFGAQIMGVDAAAEQRASSLPGMVNEGRYLEGSGEAVIGAALARNLGLGVGDELMLVGNAREGGVAAAVARVVGVFSTGIAELDRGLVQIPIDDFRQAWNLRADQIHALVVLLDRTGRSTSVARALAGPGRAVLDWTELTPELVQAVELKRVGAQLFFALVAVIVTFSVVNTFMMTVFERTPEFGMLMALGMRPAAIARQLCGEALCMALLGLVLGLGSAALLVAVLAAVGVPLPADVEDVLVRYKLPERIYPVFSWGAAATACIVLLLGTQLAALVPALRVLRLRPVQALRAME